MAGLATTTGPLALSPPRCIAVKPWIVRVRKPALLLPPGPDLTARRAATSVRMEWISFSFSCFRGRSLRGLETASVLGCEALEQRRKADLDRTAVGAPEMELAGGEPIPQEGRRDPFAKAVALDRHGFHFGATSRAPGHDGLAPPNPQQTFGLYRDPCRFH